MEIDTTAILVYGYTKEDAEVIKQRMDNLTEKDVVLLDGSEKEGMIINDIMSSGSGFSYKEEENKIVMFIGFEGSQIEKCLNFFPRGDIVRPIFCSLTEQNIGWTLEHLLDDLNKEHRTWTKKHKVTVKRKETTQLPEKTLEELREALDTPIDQEFVEEDHPELADVDEDVEPISLEGMMGHDEGHVDLDSIIAEVEGYHSDEKEDIDNIIAEIEAGGESKDTDSEN
jgi:hypothetical protein